MNSTAIRFLWTPPPQQFVNGINQGYKVRLSRPRVPVPWAVRGASRPWPHQVAERVDQLTTRGQSPEVTKG